MPERERSFRQYKCEMVMGRLPRDNEGPGGVSFDKR